MVKHFLSNSISFLIFIFEDEKKMEHVTHTDIKSDKQEKNSQLHRIFLIIFWPIIRTFIRNKFLATMLFN